MKNHLTIKILTVLTLPPKCLGYKEMSLGLNNVYSVRMLLCNNFKYTKTRKNRKNELGM